MQCPYTKMVYKESMELKSNKGQYLKAILFMESTAELFKGLLWNKVLCNYSEMVYT